MRPPPPRALRAFVIATMVALAALTGGCESVVGVEPGPHTSRLVVLGLFQPGQPWDILVTRTVGTGDTTDVYDAMVTDATVEIRTAAGPLVTLGHRDRGHYTADTALPEPGITYTLRVSAPGFAPVEATSSAPPPLDVVAVLTHGEDGRTSVHVQYVDPAGRGDTYSIQLLAPVDTTGGGAPALTAVGFQTDAPSIRNESFFDSISEGSSRPLYYLALFSDVLFDGREVTFDLDLFDESVAPTRAELTRASPAYYGYLRTLFLLQDAEENPFAEPIIPYSNVEGGLGAFAGYTPSGVTLEGPTP
jgi:Domain of unknown function (DUF4249)